MGNLYEEDGSEVEEDKSHHHIHAVSDTSYQSRLLLEPRTTRYGCGIYEAGRDGVRMFVTDSGRFIPVQGRIISPEDLMEVYVWGRMDVEKQKVDVDRLHALRNEIDCRIEHGAAGHGHLEYVLDQLDSILS